MSLRVLTEIEVQRCCTNVLHTCAINYESPPGDAHSLLTNLYNFFYRPSCLFTPTSHKNQCWIWSLRVWVTRTKDPEAPAYELRRHPKDRMLLMEMYPWRPHREPCHCLLKSLIHYYRNKRIYHQRNHIFGRKTDAGICVLHDSYSKTCTN